MLSDFDNSEGSALKNAITMTSSWGGLLQQIAYNWTGFVQTIATDNFATGILNAINQVIFAIKELSQVFGSLPTLAAGVGIFEFIKNFG